MIDKRFSKEIFDKLGWDSKDAHVLCDCLKAEICDSLMSLLVPASRRIVEKLNSMGHALEDDSKPGYEIYYRELIKSGKSGDYKMLFAVDLIITVCDPRVFHEEQEK
jgi:hypothetical protein